MMNDQSFSSPTVEGYVLNERIGRGSYSVVFKATSNIVGVNGTREVVAVKCIFKQRICSTQTAQDNLIREIRILKRLSHPHIVNMKDFQWDKNYIYLITEYCSGGDLSAFIRRQRCLAEPVARKFLQQLSSAMRYLRSRNISHMDLKPQNILISFCSSMGKRRRPVLKLADFGFALYLRSVDDATSIRGSPLYMAPEMFLNQAYDASVDLWSIGVILHECIFGKAPFACSTMEELSDQIRSGAPVVLPDRPPISDDCRHLLTNLLERDVRRRMNFDEFFSHPFIDLEHAPSEECTKKATALVKDAVRADETGKLAEAINLYSAALAYFLPAIQYEEDPDAKEALRTKARQYLRRAETLKSILVPKRKGLVEDGTSRRPMTANSTGSAYGHAESGYEENEEIGKLRELWTDVPEVSAILTVVSAAEEILNNSEERYEEALEKYTLAIETVLRIMSNEPKTTRRDLLRRFADRWLDRAQELKVYLDVRKLNLSKLEEKEAVMVSVEENSEMMAQEKTCCVQ